MSKPASDTVDFLDVRREMRFRKRFKPLVDSRLLNHIENATTFVDGEAWSWSAVVGPVLDCIQSKKL